MPTRLTDEEIGRLVAERKPLPRDYEQRFQMKPKRGHKERELAVKGETGSDFRLILRQSDLNPLDFSAILAYQPPNTNEVFRLRRYNGKHGEHTNKLEHQRFFDFHIHLATQRYQDAGFDEDAYAEPTGRYADLDRAARCLIEDCAFEAEPDPQLRFF